MRLAALLVASAGLLAACHSEVNEKNASVRQVAKAVRESGVVDDSFVRAGEWRVKGTFVDIDGPGMPPQAKAQMKQFMARMQDAAVTYCLTPEQAKHPAGRMFGGKDAGNCRYDHFKMGGGKFDIAMQCTGQGSAGSMTMQASGTYTPDRYQSRSTMNMQGGPRGPMTMTVSSTAERIGECTAEDLKEAQTRLKQQG
jgi:Protein of unknown function (DUF3617)